MLLIRFMSRLLSSYYTNKSTGLRHCASSTSLLKHNPIRRRRTESLIPLQDCYIFRDVQGHAIITYYTIPIIVLLPTVEKA